MRGEVHHGVVDATAPEGNEAHEAAAERAVTGKHIQGERARFGKKRGNKVVFRLPFKNWNNRTEEFFLHERILAGNTGKNGRLNFEGFRYGSSAGNERCSILLGTGYKRG